MKQLKLLLFNFILISQISKLIKKLKEINFKCYLFYIINI
jgi:hypothetical protein